MMRVRRRGLFMLELERDGRAPPAARLGLRELVNPSDSPRVVSSHAATAGKAERSAQVEQDASSRSQVKRRRRQHVAKSREELPLTRGVRTLAKALRR